MRTSRKILSLLSVLSLGLVSNVGVANAAIGVTSLDATTSIGNITSLAGAFIWSFNVLRYLGWAGVILGVGLAIFGLIYKLFGTESEEAMKTVQGYVTKAVIIVIAGILLISAGFIVRQIGNLVGLSATDAPLSVEVITGTP